jgi:hypothetical protein
MDKNRAWNFVHLQKPEVFTPFHCRGLSNFGDALPQEFEQEETEITE